MKKLLILLALLSCSAFAQTTTPTASWNGIETQQLLANCVLHNTDSVVCVATDGISFSYQGAPFVKLTAPTAPTVNPVLAVNGKKPDSTGNVTISASTTSSTTSTTTLQ